MLLLNDGQDNYGCFSNTGVKAIKENALLLRYEQKRFLKKSPSSSSVSNLFDINEKIKIENHLKENDFDIFTIEDPDKENLDDIAKDIIKKHIKKVKTEKKEKRDSFNTNNSKINELKSKSKYFYHNNHVNKKRKEDMVPSCTKYNPKYDAILRRSASSPLWKYVTGRKEPKKDKYDFPFYLSQDLIQDNMAGKAFIDFSKQTIRKCFLENDKKNNNNSCHINKNIIKKLLSTNKRPFTGRNKPININKIKSYSNKKNNNLSDTDLSNDSYEIFKNAYKKQLIKSKLENKNRKNKKKEENRKKIKTIDFNQIISRETLDEMENNKIAVVPYLFPNYKSVRERPVMMVIYDKKKHKINKSKSEMLLKISNYSYDKKNNIHVHSPNFDLMTSRPYDEKDPLPIYMKGIYDKNSCYKITGESLKSNNYSNRGFAMNKSSFWPKNSYNKFINLNFLKSKKMFYKALLFNKNNPNNSEILEKSLKFYFKNYDNITKSYNLPYYKKELVKSLGKDINKNKPIKQLIKEIKKKKV